MKAHELRAILSRPGTLEVVTYRATPRLQEARALVRGFWQLVHGEGEARRA